MEEIDARGFCTVVVPTAVATLASDSVSARRLVGSFMVSERIVLDLTFTGSDSETRFSSDSKGSAGDKSPTSVFDSDEVVMVLAGLFPIRFCPSSSSYLSCSRTVNRSLATSNLPSTPVISS